MEYSDLTPEQQARAKACKTPEELMALAKSEGIELSDEQLDAVAGGGWQSPMCKQWATCRTLVQCPLRS